MRGVTTLSFVVVSSQASRSASCEKRVVATAVDVKYAMRLHGGQDGLHYSPAMETGLCNKAYRLSNAAIAFSLLLSERPICTYPLKW